MRLDPLAREKSLDAQRCLDHAYLFLSRDSKIQIGTLLDTLIYLFLLSFQIK
jgi:hypothetical protein